MEDNNIPLDFLWEGVLKVMPLTLSTPRAANYSLSPDLCHGGQAGPGIEFAWLNRRPGSERPKCLTMRRRRIENSSSKRIFNENLQRWQKHADMA